MNTEMVVVLFELQVYMGKEAHYRIKMPKYFHSLPVTSSLPPPPPPFSTCTRTILGDPCLVPRRRCAHVADLCVFGTLRSLEGFATHREVLSQVCEG